MISSAGYPRTWFGIGAIAVRVASAGTAVSIATRSALKAAYRTALITRSSHLLDGTGELRRLHLVSERRDDLFLQAPHDRRHVRANEVLRPDALVLDRRHGERDLLVQVLAAPWALADALDHPGADAAPRARVDLAERPAAFLEEADEARFVSKVRAVGKPLGLPFAFQAAAEHARRHLAHDRRLVGPVPAREEHGGADLRFELRHNPRQVVECRRRHRLPVPDQLPPAHAAVARGRRASAERGDRRTAAVADGIGIHFDRVPIAGLERAHRLLALAAERAVLIVGDAQVLLEPVDGLGGGERADRVGNRRERNVVKPAREAIDPRIDLALRLFDHVRIGEAVLVVVREIEERARAAGRDLDLGLARVAHLRLGPLVVESGAGFGVSYELDALSRCAGASWCDGAS